MRAQVQLCTGVADALEAVDAFVKHAGLS